MAEIERVVVVTKKTALEELVYRLNSKAQARFYLEQNQIPFSEYELAAEQYQRAVDTLKKQLPRNIKQQFIDREFLPTYQFDEHDLVMTVGPDGLVVNTAKYLTTQPLLALNPDPMRVDGILNPFSCQEAGEWLDRARAGKVKIAQVSMVKASLNDGQELYAVNDLFIGPRTHGSARYELDFMGRREQQSSSGIIVSTGAGCTGWLRSITQGAWHVTHHFGGASHEPPTVQEFALGWESEQLWFTVREPFVSKTAQANIVFEQISAGEELIITSQMPENGVIFSDGIESDYLNFNSGFVAHIRLAERKAHLITKS
jgi:NAD kinase